MTDARPRPVTLPRCAECGGPHGSKAWQPRHRPDCSIHLAAQTHWANVKAVEKAIADAIAERRQDRPFMGRLARRLQDDAAILDRLAAPAPQPTEENRPARPYQEDQT